MQLIDTHCHLYLHEFDEDWESVIWKAQELGVIKIFLPNIDAQSITPMFEVVAGFPWRCFAMMGLHPCSVTADWEQQLAPVKEFLFNQEEHKFYGIGETGLDYHWDKSFVEQQKQSFQSQIEWAKQLKLPIIIHSRDALDDCIAMIKKNKDDNLTGIFHCFSGTKEQANQIIELGFYLGIGGVVTYKNSGLDVVLKDVDLNHLVLETDAPYLAPVPHRGERNDSTYLPLIAAKLADIKGITVDEVASATTTNAVKVFQVTP